MSECGSFVCEIITRALYVLSAFLPSRYLCHGLLKPRLHITIKDNILEGGILLAEEYIKLLIEERT
jgi:hypothetical protein